MNILDYFLMFRYYLYGQSEHTNTGVHKYTQFCARGSVFLLDSFQEVELLSQKIGL